MKNVDEFDQRTQIRSELLQGLEFAKQLQNQISNKTNNISLCNDHNEELKYELILEKMMSTFDKDIIAPPSQPDLRASKRRKNMPMWTTMVRIGPDESVDNRLKGPFNDEFSWMKYGQKQDYGAMFMREYFRCTHRPSNGCLATKQVQRCDEDPSLFKVVYRGEHTCCPGPNIQEPPAELLLQKIENLVSYSPDFSPPTTPVSTNLSLAPYQFTGPSVGLRVQTSESDLNDSNSGRKSVHNLPMTMGEDDFEAYLNSLFKVRPIPDSSQSRRNRMLSDLTSTSTKLSVSPYQFTRPRVGLRVQFSESDLNDSYTGQNSVNNLPMTLGDDDLEVSLDQSIART